MENSTTKTLNLANLPDKEISLDEAYAQSASQDKLIAADFDVFLCDGLADESASTICDINAAS